MAVNKTCPAIFVTGTDTGVGKTLVTSALAHHFTARGLNVGVMKPIETGVQDTGKLGPDGELLRWSSGSKDSSELISPYRYQAPLSPHQAASLVQEKVDMDVISTAFQELCCGKDLVLVEGAGGLMVPISGGFLMADMARQLELSLLVVTHPRLGTLNHTLLTTYSARAMELPVSGFIINQMPDCPDQAEEMAPHLLASMASADLMGVLPEVSGTDKNKVKKISETIGNLTTYTWLTVGLGLG